MINTLLTNLLTQVLQTSNPYDDFAKRWEEFWSVGHLVIVALKLSLIPISIIIVKFLISYAIKKIKRMERKAYTVEDVIDNTWQEKQLAYNIKKKKRELNKEVSPSKVKRDSILVFLLKFYYYSLFKPQKLVMEKEELKINYTPQKPRSFEVESVYNAVKIKFGLAMKNRLLDRDKIKAIVDFLEQNLQVERYPKDKKKEKIYKNDTHYIYSCLKHSENLTIEHLKAMNTFLDEYANLENIAEDVDYEHETIAEQKVSKKSIPKDNVLPMTEYKVK